MDYWIWLVLGIGLMALELFVPTGFYLFILGLAGVLVGLVVATGLMTSFNVQAVAFSVVAIGIWFGLGEKLRRLFFKKPAQPGQLVGKVVKVASAIPAGQVGSGDLWGTQWRLENVDSVELQAGAKAVVVAAEGVTLKVKRH